MNRRTFLTTAIASWLLPTGRADARPAPAKVQATVLKKIMRYDAALPRGNVGVAVVYASSSSALHQMVGELKKARISTEALSADAFVAGGAGQAQVVYVMPGATTPAVRDRCRKDKLLSVTGDPAVVAQGLVQVSVDLRDDNRPRITVHLAETQAAGHRLSARLLALSEVIR